MIDSNSPEFVEALARGLSVLEAFDAKDPEMTLAELSRKVGMSIATVRRNVLTLEALGFIRRHNKHFLLAPRILTLGSAYLNAFNVEEAVTPELHRITSLFGDAANMAVLDGTNVLYIAHLSESRGVRRNASLGVTYPAYATSMGRVLMAALAEEEMDRFFQAYTPLKLTDYTVTDEAELREILVETRAKGYSITVDQLDYGITALAVPVKDNTGRVVCAINSSGYTPRLTPEELVQQRLPELRLAANRLSQLFSRFPALVHSLAPANPTAR
ncbi:IclR family transcriptional regulator domain-containing protein [Neorhizobium vignae]|uniref:IclR family transcriptional regulator domain-containing protein n=1 Tax=Neorhizobium vignae TaxID=690585 RepID=UPI00056520EB|nr:IclR family transcriptional regulator C-terminal domain-containing protein [Neorhizobium vignae]